MDSTVPDNAGDHPTGPALAQELNLPEDATGVLTQIRMVAAAMGPHRWAILLTLVLQAVGVAVEGAALVSLAGLTATLLDTDVFGADKGVLALPETVLGWFGMEQSAGSMTLFISLLFVLSGLLRIVGAGMVTYIRTTYSKIHYDELIELQMKADWEALTGRRGSDLMNVVLLQVSKGGGAVAAVVATLTSVLAAVVYLTFAAAVSPVAVLLFATTFAVLIGVLSFPLRLVRRLASELIPIQGRLIQRLSETVGNAKVLKALGAEDKVLSDVRSDTSHVRRQSTKIGVLIDLGTGLELGIIVSLVILFVVSTTGLTSVVNAGVIAVILFRVSQRVQAVVSGSGYLIEGLPGLEVVARTTDELRAVTEPPGGIEVPPHDAVRFDGVSFAYGSGREVLEEMNLEIGRGEFIGIVGESGSGKTTLVDLFLGLLNPTSGAVLVGDTPLHELDRLQWRRRIGYVPQDAALLNATVASNIRAFREDLSQEDVCWAAEVAQAAGFISRLQRGYDEPVGDRGVTLSGGERQRIALARALVTRPDILLLDEATSSLDTRAEAQFQHALEALRGQFTIVAVAHRLSTVMRADRIIVLRDGRIVESGPAEELLRTPGGDFSRLYRLQARDA